MTYKVLLYQNVIQFEAGLNAMSAQGYGLDSWEIDFQQTGGPFIVVFVKG